jgi:hypothetical protein
MEGRKSQPLLVGLWLWSLSHLGSSGLVSKVVLQISGTTCLQPDPYHTKKQRKLPTPKMLNHKVRQSRKVGVGWGEGW